MGLLTVTSDPQGISGIMSIDVDDVIYIACNPNPKIKDGLIVHTIDKEYYMIGSLKHWVTCLNNSGYQFNIADRSNAANIDKIVWLDGFYKVAYFGMDKNSKKCNIAFGRYKEVASELITINPRIAVAR